MFNIFKCLFFKNRKYLFCICFLFPLYPVTFLTVKGGEKEKEYVREGLIKATGAWH